MTDRKPDQGRASRRAIRSAGPAICLSLAAVVAVVGPWPAAAAADDPVQAGAEALRAGPRTPWYDRSEDQEASVQVRPSRDVFRHRQSNWRRDPAAPAAGPSWSWSGDFWAFMETLAWLALVLLIAMLIAFLIKQYLDARRLVGFGLSSAEEGEADWYDEGRVEELPVAVGKGDLLSQARSAYEAGDLDRAIIYLYSYQLLRLDGGQIIRLARGKTNRQYLFEARRDADLQRLLERTMVAFEDVYFGRHPLTRDRFEACWRSLDQFHQRLERTAA